jgi:hypothetical protein
MPSQSHPGLAYMGGNHIYRTADGGLTWQPWIGGDVAGDDVFTLLGGYLP